MFRCTVLEEKSLAILAHELRHPLAPLRSAIEIIRRLDIQEPQLARACQILDRQTRWLTQLIEGLFDLACLDTAPITLHRERLDLAEVIEQALEISRPLLAQNHHWVTVTLPEIPVLVEGDRLRLIQVLANLLNNAAHYTEAGGIIDIEVRRTEAEAQVSIRDNGPGIAADLLPRLFEPFVQGDSPRRGGAAGLGIGLTVVKALVERHQGRIEVRSAGSGEGTEFSVYLPLGGALPEFLPNHTFRELRVG
jgi:signal transduction histidine kinase